MGERIEFGTPLKWYVLIGVLAPLTLGIALVIFFQRGKWPRFIDERGVTLRNGQEIPWKELTSANWAQVGWSRMLHLNFGATQVTLNPTAMTRVDEAAAFVSRFLKQPL